MAPDLRRSPTASLLAALGAALLAGGAVGAAWRVDAQRRDRHARRLHRATVELLLNTLTAGDPVTARHSRRVANLVRVAAATYGLDARERSTLRLAGLLHDMGKLDDRFFDIVHSCSKLTPEQREEIKAHPGQSADILEPLEAIHPGLMKIVASHHECWDGTGYPNGLRGEEIPLGARIISVADVFDAMTQPRTYRPPLPVQQTLEEIGKAAGSKFDPEVVARIERPAVLVAWSEIARTGRAEEERLRVESPEDSVSRASA